MKRTMNVFASLLFTTALADDPQREPLDPANVGTEARFDSLDRN